MKIKTLANDENNFEYDGIKKENHESEEENASKIDDMKEKDVQCKTNESAEIHVHIVV